MLSLTQFLVQVPAIQARELKKTTSPETDEIRLSQSSVDPDLSALSQVSLPGIQPYREHKIIPAPFYTPDTSLGLAIISTYFYRFKGYPHARASSVTNALVLTLQKQFQFTHRANFYVKNDEWYIWHQLQGRIWPDLYFGYGNRLTESSESYLSRSVMFIESVQKRFGKYVFFGPYTEFHYFAPTQFQDGGRLAQEEAPGTRTHLLNWSGLNLSLDHRDNPNATHSGGWYQLDIGGIADLRGGPFHQFRASLDLRHFVAVNENQTFATRLHVTDGAGAPGSLPFTLMRSLGGESRLRGIPIGKYRDQSALWGIAEYRVELNHRFSTLFYTGAGQVAEHITQLRGDRFQPIVGTGLRFAILPTERVNLRFDVAVHGSQFSTYIVAGEAF